MNSGEEETENKKNRNITSCVNFSCEEVRD